MTGEPYFATAERDGWTLVDAVRAYAERDGVYWLPGAEACESFPDGTLVKVVFEWANSGADGPKRERMWVSVACEGGGAFHGHLDNDPFLPNPPIKCGEGLWFRAEHVVDVLRPGEKPLSDQVETVRCACHIVSEPCYVCEHLSAESSVGFNHGEEGTLRPDAWCDACEALVGAKASWDEVAQHPQIRLVCGGCYDDIRARNRR